MLHNTTHRINPNSLVHLNPARPGEVRNPNGRPKGSPNRSRIVKKWLDAGVDYTDPDPDTGQILQITVEDKIILSMIRRADSGDVAAAHFLFDSKYGKLKTGVQIEAPPVEEKIDYSRFSNEELSRLAELQKEMMQIVSDVQKITDVEYIEEK